MPRVNPFRPGIQAAEMLVAGTPDITVADLLDELRDWADNWDAEVEDLTERATCRRCIQPIFRIGDSPWRHSDPSESRGCRAASFRSNKGWDNSLKREWDALPK